MAGDVFEEQPSGCGLGGDAGDMGPEVAGIAFRELAAGGRERLAGITRSEEIHRATPGATIEGGKVVPHRRVT